MTNWDAIILELMQEHGLPIPKEPENKQILDGMLHERRLKALIAESKMPVLPRQVKIEPLDWGYGKIQRKPNE